MLRGGPAQQPCPSLKIMRVKLSSKRAKLPRLHAVSGRQSERGFGSQRRESDVRCAAAVGSKRVNALSMLLDVWRTGEGTQIPMHAIVKLQSSSVPLGM